MQSREGPTRRTKIPGYGGYIPKHHEFADTGPSIQSKDPKKVIPGYGGYVPAVASENVHGATFGTINEKFAQGEVLKGRIYPASERFKTMQMVSYKDPQAVKMPPITVAAQTAVVEAKKAPSIPLDVVHKFWGTESTHDPKAKEHEYAKATATFFGS